MISLSYVLIILHKFMTCDKFEPLFSYKLNSDKKKSVLLFLLRLLVFKTYASHSMTTRRLGITVSIQLLF